MNIKFLFKLPVITPLFILLVASCSPKNSANEDSELAEVELKDSTDLLIAFGSCSKQNKEDQLWPEITELNPEYWIWLGDNIYGDTHNMDTLRKKYQMQKNRPSYQEFILNRKVLGTWDDHDYGINDGGKNYPFKESSKTLALDFYGYPLDHPVRTHEGIYHKEYLQSGDKKFPLLILDTRWFRDTIQRDENKAYIPNETGTILGENQWSWLENEIATASEDLVFIASSIQFLSDKHRFEKWANFPKEHKKLMDLLKSKPKTYIILSGDRHSSSMSKRMLNDEYAVWDITSSGLTEAIGDRFTAEENPWQLGQVITQDSYGLIEVDTSKKQLTVQLRGEQNELLANQYINY